jgi:pimeloyl-ACP methyl ester carboxylesterase
MTVTEGTVSTNGVELHYERTGASGGPAVVLVHGITDIADVWRVTAQALAPRYDVVLYDARGHGSSSKPESGYTPADHSADLVGLIRGLGLERPRVLGHSMGASTAALAAATAPELISCLLLEDPPWSLGAARSPEERRQFADAWRAEVAGHKGLGRAELIERCRERSPSWPEDELSAWADAKQRVSLEVFEYVSAPQLDWEATVARITCPLLLITGDPARSAIVTPEVARRVRELAPHAQVAQIDGAGHSIRREQRERYLAAVLDFLRAYDGAAG